MVSASHALLPHTKSTSSTYSRSARLVSPFHWAGLCSRALRDAQPRALLQRALHRRPHRDLEVEHASDLARRGGSSASSRAAHDQLKFVQSGFGLCTSHTSAGGSCGVQELLVGVTKAGREDIDGMGSRAVGIHIMSEEPLPDASPSRCRCGVCRQSNKYNPRESPRDTAILSRYAYRANGRAPSHQT